MRHRLMQMLEVMGTSRIISGDNTNRIDSHGREVAMNS